MALLLPATAHASRPPLRRFALVAGANDGGAERVRLRHAGTDAQRMARVLEELGGVDPGDRVLLVDPDRMAVQEGLASIEARLRAAQGANERTELFFYYSGHSDETGLLLGEERLGYEELRAALEELSADVRVAIVDSCASGALTRRKGGVRRPPFLLDEASQVKGHAFLTSASAEEAAQESDLIGASFFTHYLLSGLRGAADTSRDGKVTLNEAYHFAFNETLARTTRTSAGAQHPAYEMHLAGTGDLVMTDLRTTSAALVIDEAIGGRIYVRDGEGALVVELRKERAAPPVELGLAPGPYTVLVDDRGRLAEAQLTLTSDRRAHLTEADFTSFEGEITRQRGGTIEDDEWVVAPFVLGLAPGASTLPEGVPADRVEAQFALNLIGGRTGRLDGAAIGLGLNWITDRASGTMFAGAANLVEGEMEGAQFSTAFNHVDGAMEGAQFAAGYNGAGRGGTMAQFSAGANWSGGSMSGLQATGGANFSSGFMDGAQLATGLNLASVDASGFQAAGGVNWVGGRMDGAQIAAGLNRTAADVDGWQVAGAVNLAGGDVRGAQIGGALSLAGDVSGAQISAVNIGGAIDGAQIGVVNVATGVVSGPQIGVVNVSEDTDAPIGLVNVLRRGRYHLALWADETNAANLGFKMGGRHLYTLLTAGTSTRESTDGKLRWTVGAGLGGHVDLGWTPMDFLNVELLTRQLAYGDSFLVGGHAQLTTLRLGAGWQLAPRLALIAGPTLNVSVSDADDARDGFGLFGETAVLHDGDHKLVRLWPGLFVGLQI